LIDSRPPLPPGETRANQDVQKQFQDAKDAIPSDLKPKDTNGDVIEEEKHDAQGNNTDRSWFSRLTFGVFD
jgi:outer membrane protein assembly factor BamD